MTSNGNLEIKGLIPTIGIISSGKSTFLDALLGTDVLEVGETTITEFILFIKNNNINDEYLFQNIRLGKDYKKGIFKRKGEVTSGEENIKNKIRQLNKDLKNNNDEIKKNIYLLEMPIKNINNKFLLENYCFMDLPGLNEISNQEKYLNILEMFGLELIKFEIFIFDSTVIGSDNVKNIFIKLNEKKCLTKKNSLFILNKIDKCEKEERKKIIEDFSFYLYNTFGDGSLKNADNNNKNVYINIYRNTLISMNSLLFRAENILFQNQNFSCLLEKELFTYLDERGEDPSFYEYLNKKKIKLLKEADETLNFENEEKEEEIIDDGIDNINILIENLNLINFQNGIDIENNEHLMTLKNIYLLYKNNKWRINFSNMFYETNKFFEDFEEKCDDEIETEDTSLINSSKISCYSDYESTKEKERKSIQIFSSIAENNQVKEIEIEYNQEKKILDRLDNFISKNLNEFINGNNKINGEKQKNNFKALTNHIYNIKKNLMNKKIRVTFIGNLSAGKSSILNCIIGEEILPIDQVQCTYRGIIVRYRDEPNFKLYKTKLEKEGSILYYYFKDEKNSICEGVKDINSFLSTKNKDTNVLDNDAYFILTGKLKILRLLKRKMMKNFIN